METKISVSLSDFRIETRAWLESNCPESMRQPVKDPFDLLCFYYKSKCYLYSPLLIARLGYVIK